MFYLKNVPGWERALRLLVGVAGAAVAFMLVEGTMGMVLALSAAGIALSGLAGFCPMCAMLGRRLKQASSQ